jgi:cytochrome c biogenesis protein CcdA
MPLTHNHEEIPLDTLLTVTILGLSVEGLVLCPFLAFGLSLSDKLAGVRFLLGRLLGLVCFGVVVSLLGKAVHIDERIMNLIFGISILILGLWRTASLEDSAVGWKVQDFKARLGLKSCRNKGKDLKAGFGLGLFRGLCNPGRKYLYLAPFLLDLGVFKGLAVSFVYGVSSSVYLVLGFVSAGFIGRMTPHRQRLGMLGGAVLIVVGGYYVLKARTLVV